MSLDSSFFCGVLVSERGGENHHIESYIYFRGGSGEDTPPFWIGVVLWFCTSVVLLWCVFSRGLFLEERFLKERLHACTQVQTVQSSQVSFDKGFKSLSITFI